MRNSCCSSKAVWISAESAFAESRECPNGFSTTMRESAVFARSRPGPFTIVGNVDGGTAR